MTIHDNRRTDPPLTESRVQKAIQAMERAPAGPPPEAWPWLAYINPPPHLLPGVEGADPAVAIETTGNSCPTCGGLCCRTGIGDPVGHSPSAPTWQHACPDCDGDSEVCDER